MYVYFNAPLNIPVEAGMIIWINSRWTIGENLCKKKAHWKKSSLPLVGFGVNPFTSRFILQRVSRKLSHNQIGINDNAWVTLCADPRSYDNSQRGVLIHFWYWASPFLVYKLWSISPINTNYIFSVTQEYDLTFFTFCHLICNIFIFNR